MAYRRKKRVFPLKTLAKLLVGLVAGIGVGTQLQSPTPVAKQIPITSKNLVEVYFSPRGGAEAAIVRQIEKSKKSLYIMAYSFTSTPIVKAIIKAHQRGVKIALIADKVQSKGRGSKVKELYDLGIPVYIDMRSGCTHNKVIIIDDRILITGSYNFSAAAEKTNRENLLILLHPELVQAYQKNWQTNLNHHKVIQYGQL